jgi:hypothetical protein
VNNSGSRCPVTARGQRDGPARRAAAITSPLPARPQGVVPMEGTTRFRWVLRPHQAQRVTNKAD